MGPVFIALDFAEAQTALAFLDQFPDSEPLAVKVGMELYYAAGPEIIQELRRRHATIFLDLKLCDIPHTVEQAAAQLAAQEVSYLTVMALGGGTMIQQAKQGLLRGSQQVGVQPAKLLAVTQLTSTSESQMNQDLQIPGSLGASVTHLAQLAQTNGADGVIASALEDPQIHQATTDEFLCINPGIRRTDNTNDDQKRVVTPQKAAALGSNGLVVGRPITQASDPVASYHEFLKEWSAQHE
ncbi:orotidine-5'-phosphate decarboxylase [Lactobacillus sp. DCY120]|uniref:Orotidine 5'-phosphate decarboxylase n=1 Tax=Bombilactobacillus apium TaxID=2675299 RepID=A0A850R0C0_9LACO|nr:orotidine-5'-phosphate decarboxylase [Bombilactobacillus apium]NVY96499.1 orotidine-5'-phosphate decarboxylase [Bombilactobacillus apium]